MCVLLSGFTVDVRPDSRANLPGQGKESGARLMSGEQTKGKPHRADVRLSTGCQRRPTCND
jgi:hypothetical protein